jgi:acetyl-CoA C-acetyltransferase
MPEAYIVDAIRTPVGKRGGGLSGVHPADPGAHVLKTIVERNNIDPLAVEDVFFGCVDTIGPQAGDIPPAGWPLVCPKRFPERQSTSNSSLHDPTPTPR